MWIVTVLPVGVSGLILAGVFAAAISSLDSILAAVTLTAFTILMEKATQGISILPLAFGMTTYAMGPMLGLFLGALTGKASFRGLAAGVVLSFLFTLFTEFPVHFVHAHGCVGADEG